MKRGFTGFIVAAVGVVVAIILLYAVVQPVINTQIQSTSANLAGYATAQTVSLQLPVFVALTALVTLAALAISAFRT